MRRGFYCDVCDYNAFVHHFWYLTAWNKPIRNNGISGTRILLERYRHSLLRRQKSENTTTVLVVEQPFQLTVQCVQGLSTSAIRQP